VRIVLHEKGLDYERRVIDISKGEQRSEEYLSVNAQGKVPTLVDNVKKGGEDTKVVVYDSTIINEYLEDAYPEPRLFPAAPAMKAAARTLEDWADNNLVEPLGVLFAQNVFTSERKRNPARISEARMRTVELLRRLETMLSDNRTYLLGEFSIADIAMTPSMAYAFHFGAPIQQMLPKVTLWYTRLKNRPSFDA